MGENILEKVKQLETLFGKYEITGRELMQVRTLADKIEKQEMTVSVIGQFKRRGTCVGKGILSDSPDLIKIIDRRERFGVVEGMVADNGVLACRQNHRFKRKTAGKSIVADRLYRIR